MIVTTPETVVRRDFSSKADSMSRFACNISESLLGRQFSRLYISLQTLSKDKRITLRLSSFDLDAIQAKAIEEGIPYQTLISSILHKYAIGLLVDRRQEGSK
jgi:predicted DNA binding CopG/RHH family protein